MDKEGALPLETRRGARALWYIRQAITDLSVIAEIYERNGDDLYGLKKTVNRCRFSPTTLSRLFGHR